MDCTGVAYKTSVQCRFEVEKQSSSPLKTNVSLCQSNHVRRNSPKQYPSHPGEMKRELVRAGALSKARADSYLHNRRLTSSSNAASEEAWQAWRGRRFKKIKIEVNQKWNTSGGKNLRQSLHFLRGLPTVWISLKISQLKKTESFQILRIIYLSFMSRWEWF